MKIGWWDTGKGCPIPKGVKNKVGCAPGQPDLGGVIPVHNRESELDDLKGPLQSKPFYDSMKMAIWYDTHFYFYPWSQISVHIEQPFTLFTYKHAIIPNSKEGNSRHRIISLINSVQRRYITALPTRRCHCIQTHLAIWMQTCRLSVWHTIAWNQVCGLTNHGYWQRLLMSCLYWAQTHYTGGKLRFVNTSWGSDK